MLPDPLLSRQVFLWAAEMGVHYWTDLLLAADTPVDPNTFYLSPIIRPRLLDTFQAQGRKGKAGPAYDNTFKTEIIREGVNRHPTNGYLHWASTVNWAVWSAANLGTMDLEDLKGFLPGHNLNLGHFGPVVNINTHSMGYWRWSAIHLAVRSTLDSRSRRRFRTIPIYDSSAQLQGSITGTVVPCSNRQSRPLDSLGKYTHD